MYEAEEGESRWAALRRRYYELEQEHARYQELFSLLITSSEADAMALFRSLRSGSLENPFSSLAPIHPSDAPPTPSTALRFSTTKSEHRLPPINSLLGNDVSMHGVSTPTMNLATSGSEDGLDPSSAPDGVPTYHPRSTLTTIDPMLGTRSNFPPMVPTLGSESSGSSMSYGSPGTGTVNAPNSGPLPILMDKRHRDAAGSATMVAPTTRPPGSPSSEAL